MVGPVFAVVCGCAEDLRPDNPDAGSDGSTPADTRITHTDNGDGTVTTRVDATDESEWVYLDLEARSEVIPDDPATSADWDLSFQRFMIRIDGGVSGAGGMELVVLADVDFDALTEAPAAGYITDRPDGDDEDQDPDLAFLSEGGWYSYDPTTHTLSPRDLVYVVRSVEGNHYKVEMLDYYDAAGTSGFPAFRWAPIQ
jgi:hypothetical protein